MLQDANHHPLGHSWSMLVQATRLYSSKMVDVVCYVHCPVGECHEMLVGFVKVLHAKEQYLKREVLGNMNPSSTSQCTRLKHSLMRISPVCRSITQSPCLTSNTLPKTNVGQKNMGSMLAHPCIFEYCPLQRNSTTRCSALGSFKIDGY